MMTPRLTLPRRCRLAHDREFQAVYGAKMKKIRGPLILFSRPNELPYPRLGLAISRRVGGAVVRVRVKRLLREAFRHVRLELPRHSAGCYDFVVSARGSDGASLDEYSVILRELAALAHHDWQRRAARTQPGGESPAT